WTMVRELGVRGTPLALFFVAVAVQPYIDAMVLSMLTPTAVVGFYGAARNIVGVLIAPAPILSAPPFPHMFHPTQHPIEPHQIIQIMLRPMLLLGGLAAVGCYLFAEVAVDVIYGASGFGPSVEVLQFYAPVLFLIFFDILLVCVVTALGRERALAL